MWGEVGVAVLEGGGGDGDGFGGEEAALGGGVLVGDLDGSERGVGEDDAWEVVLSCLRRRRGGR